MARQAVRESQSAAMSRLQRRSIWKMGCSKGPVAVGGATATRGALPPGRCWRNGQTERAIKTAKPADQRRKRWAAEVAGAKRRQRARPAAMSAPCHTAVTAAKASGWDHGRQAAGVGSQPVWSQFGTKEKTSLREMKCMVYISVRSGGALRMASLRRSSSSGEISASPRSERSRRSRELPKKRLRTLRTSLCPASLSATQGR